MAQHVRELYLDDIDALVEFKKTLKRKHPDEKLKMILQHREHLREKRWERERCERSLPPLRDEPPPLPWHQQSCIATAPWTAPWQKPKNERGYWKDEDWRWAKRSSHPTDERPRSTCDFFGYELVVPVSKTSPATYQDGTPISEDEVTLYHSSRQGLLHGILTDGVHASGPSHGTEGLWTFALQMLSCFRWGRVGMETTFGMVLELKAPKIFHWGDNCPGVLHHNRKIADEGQFGCLRWVVRGTHRSPLMKVRITAVKFLLPSPRLLDFILQMRTAIKNSVCWSFGFTWSNQVDFANMPWSPWLKRWFRKLWCGEGAKGKGKGARAKGQRRDGKPCRLCQSVHEKTRALHTAKLHGRGMSAKRNTDAKNKINKIASDTMHLVEERMNYASSVGLDAAFLHSYDLTHDAVRIFARDHNISEAALSLSAVIARLLYPFFFITPANACDRVAFWREFVRRGDIPEPMMAFLKTRFSSTNWHCVLFSEGTVQAVGGRARGRAGARASGRAGGRAAGGQASGRASGRAGGRAGVCLSVCVSVAILAQG